MDKLLEIKNLRTTFSTEQGLITAVNGTSFSIHKGEIVGIAGESGSGKSATALSIMRLIASPPGKVEADQLLLHTGQGKSLPLLDIKEEKLSLLRGKVMGMIFQEPMTSLNPVFTCGEQITETLLTHTPLSKSEAKEETIRLFSRVKLHDPERIFNAYPHQLSGGQKQRVMIAMAICCKPDLLIADEPTTALDVTVQQSILHLIKEIQAETGMSVLFISHDLGVLRQLCDRIFIMYKGEIVEKGTTEAIFNTAQHPYTKSLIACKPPLDFRLKRLPVVADFMPTKEGEKTEKDIFSFVESLKITPEFITNKNTLLYAQKPNLGVKNAAVWFPQKTSFWGKATKYVKAVNDISFEVYKGETLGIVGESGSGKTTIGRAIAGLQSLHSGEIYFQNKPITDLSAKEKKSFKKEMQLIFQDPYSSLNPKKSIGSALLEGMEIHNILDTNKQRKERTEELLETVGLSFKHFNRYPQEFSGGQRQRICIARALAVEPSFLICDESVSALDVSVQAQILNLLVELREKFNLTYIFISHDLSVVRFLSDRIAVMNKGKIVELGLAEEIYSNPKTEHTQNLINSVC